MVTKTFSGNDEVNFGLEARNDAGYRVLSYGGSLGGGTLTVKTQAADSPSPVPVPDGRLSGSDLDGAGNAVQQLVFVSAGNIWVSLSGASAPTCVVSVS